MGKVQVSINEYGRLHSVAPWIPSFLRKAVVELCSIRIVKIRDEIFFTDSKVGKFISPEIPSFILVFESSANREALESISIPTALSSKQVLYVLLKSPVNHALHHPNPTEEEGLIPRDNDDQAAHQEGPFFNGSIHEAVEFIEKKMEQGPKLRIIFPNSPFANLLLQNLLFD